MKICNLTISNYMQFKNLELDLRYPKGHKKEGEPLDKICIIGQSGTGKTNLLEIIKKSVIDFSKQIESNYCPFNEFNGKETDDKYIRNKFITKNGVEVENLFTDLESKISYYDLNILENEKIYFVGVDKKPNSIKENSKYLEKEETISETLNKLKSSNFIDKTIIDINGSNNISWELLKNKIYNYQSDYSKYNNILTNKLIEDDSYTKENYIKDIQTWKKDNENILENISDKLNYILKKFNLELAKIDENQKNFTDLIIKDLSNGNIISYDNLSTGTKNLISTFIPLKIYTPQDSLILIDEPEISFYPDIQKSLTDLYMDVGVNNQLIVATHSPIIASSFEPWEVVELKFDKNNQIYRELYFKGENHIDNYFLDPRMLTWTGILTDIFDLKDDSNFSIREKALMEYATLKAEIKILDTEEEKLEKLPELQKLSKKLGLDN